MFQYQISPVLCLVCTISIALGKGIRELFAQGIPNLTYDWISESKFL